MRKGLKYFISFEEHGLIQMIDFWAYLCEISVDENGNPLYEGWVWD